MAFWNNKIVIICGGSSGLGLCLARELVRQQAKLILLLGRDRPKLDSAIAEIRSVANQTKSPTLIEAFSVDLTDAESAKQTAEAIQRLSPEVDLVVQCIGVSDRGPIAQLTRQRLLELVDVNVVTSLHAIQCFAPLLSQRRGVMVLIGSLSSLFAPRFLGGYSIAKHALAALAQQGRLELAENGTQLMLCCPGPIDRPDAGTRYSDRAVDGLPAEALQPGGGAKIDRLDPAQLANQILIAASQRRPLLILPKKAWWLRLITAFSQSLGDRLLRKRSM
jgi:uncharacterized protein